jgi:hypothetical protein
MKRTIVALALATAFGQASASTCLGFEPVEVHASFAGGFSISESGSLDCGSSTFSAGGTYFNPGIVVTVTLDDGTAFAPRLIKSTSLPPANPGWFYSPYVLVNDYLLPNTFAEGTYHVNIRGYVIAEWDQNEYHGETVFPTVHKFQNQPFNATLNVVAHAPEPETYALMLAGLGLLAWRGRRAV